MTQNTLIKPNRWLFSETASPQPVLLIAAGMHGNEQKGVEALKRMVKTKSKPLDQGKLHCFLGNIGAQNKGVRFIHEDLNRLWPIDSNQIPVFPNHEDGKEAVEIFEGLQKVLKNKEKVKFIDLHTTSAPSVPFIITDGKQECIDFSRKFPVPVVVGLPKFIPGTLLQWFNNLGHIGIAFEAGQHEEHSSEIKHHALLQLVLHFESMQALNTRKLEEYKDELSAPRDLQGVFKLIYRHEINGVFEMKPGYKNFQPVAKGEIIATENEKPIMCPFEGYMFMPLYQKHGNDGFFIVEKTA